MRILLCSPVPLKTVNRSGIHIRIEEIAKYLKKNGHQVALIDKYDKPLIDKYKYIYCLISTKEDTISYQVSQNLNKSQILIVDLYTPILLEKNLTYSPFNPINHLARKKQIGVIKKIIARATYFIVANQRQKEYWLETSKKNNATISKNKIFVLPTGAPKPSTVNRQPSNVILWFGGIYPWLDPTALINSFSSISSKNPAWKLRILGGFHPSTGYKKRFQKIIEKALSKIAKNQVEIIPWQSSKNLPEYLNDVSFAVHLPKKTKEDYFAHRVRLLTLLNYKIPVITSGTDLISNIISQNEAGLKINTRNLKSTLQLFIDSPLKVKTLSKKTSHIQGIFIKEQEKLEYFKKAINSNK